MSYEVIDLSTYNTVSNYATAARNVDGVIIRAGYRGYGSSGTLTTDKKFETHYSGLNGKTKIGVYWFSQAITENEAIAEANYVYNLIKDKTIHFPVYIDSEWSNSSHNGRADSLSKSVRTALTIAFCDRMNALGYRPGVYASDSWFNTNLDWQQLRNKGYSLWVARYSSNPPAVVNDYDGWQYTSSGTVSGVTGNVDMTHFYKDVAGWNTQPDPEPVLPNDISKLKSTIEYTTCVFDDKDHRPVVTIEGLTIAVDWFPSYINNVNVGTATVTCYGMNGYTGYIMYNFTITPAQIPNAMQLSAYTYEYTGSEIHPGHWFDDLREGRDYTVSYSNNVNVGTGTITATGMGNYVGTTSVNFTITKASISNRVPYVDELEYIETGSAITPTVHIQGLTEGRDFSVEYSNNIQPGIATATCTGINNYTGSCSCTFVISTSSIVGREIILSENTFTYSGKQIIPEASIENLVKDIDYKLTYANNINAGTATITATGINDYKGNTSTTFNILPQDISSKYAYCSPSEYYYTGEELCPIVVVEGLTKGTDYIVSYRNNIEPGTASFLVNGKGNYTGVVTGDFIIKLKDIKSCVGEIGKASTKTIYRIDGPLVVYPDESMENALVQGLDYEIINVVRDPTPEYTVVTYYIKGLSGFSGDASYSAKTGQLGDDGVYNFGDIDVGDETAVGDYDFGDLDEGVDPESVANGDYDFNVLSGDIAYDDGETVHEEWSYVGQEFNLFDTPLFANYGDKVPTDIRSGIHYTYSTIVKNERIRITKWIDALEDPVRSGGWANIKDLSRLGELNIGDRVRVNGNVYLDPNGEGSYITKENELMYILDIFEDEFEYNYALASKPTSIVQGFAKKDMLEYVE